MVMYFADSNTITWVNIAVPIVLSLITGFGVVALYKGKVDRLEKDVEKHDAKVDKLRTDVDKILEFKTQSQKFMDKDLYKDKSPLSLTDFGKSLVNDSGFKNIFEAQKDELVRLLEQQNPSTQYEVQEKARALMDTLTGYEPFKPIENWAFNNGKDFNQILRAGGILLRDYYFEKHPELVNPNENY